MKAPEFWNDGGPLATALAPLGWLWATGAALRGSFAPAPFKAPVPVLCIGNLVAGGAGKTPVALSIAHRLPGAHFLSRGYGGSEAGPLLVDPVHHTHWQVGDEPLLLAENAPCWISRDRAAGARAAAAEGARAIIMDDGFQNPGLAKDLSLLVVDGHVGFGNGHCMPAGPLREPLARGLARADAVVILGEDRKGVARLCRSLPILRARLEPEAEAESLDGQKVVAFAGIGRPAKFFNSLKNLGANVVAAYAFPDHHPYHQNEVAELMAMAKRHAAALVTTSKDYVRLPAHQREEVAVLRVTATWANEPQLETLLRKLLPRSAEARR